MRHVYDDQIQEPNDQHVKVTHQLLGVSGEEEYFDRQEMERAREVAEQRQAKLSTEEREREQALHFMKCPKCGMQLEEIVFGDVRIDKCFSCEGIFLDKGELELIRQKESGFIGRMLSVFS